MSEFPQTALVKQLNQQHPDYALYAHAWQQIATLYQGGVVMRQAVLGGQFLQKGAKELPEVFASRQECASYTNLLGNVIGWYLTALFKQPPQYVMRVADAEGEEATVLPGDAADFCEAFESDCDRAGGALTDFFRKALESLLLYRTAYVVVDTPGPDDGEAPVTLQQQQTAGLLDAFLVLYHPSSVINWETDAYGNLESATIYIRVREQAFLEDPKVMDYWYHFDRTQVALYEREVKQAGANAGPAGDERATLVPGYPRPHALAEARQVPVMKLALPDGLWLANRVLSPLINHFNQDNSLDWGLKQANLPQLVITDGPNGEYEEPVTVSAVGYHHLPAGGSMTFLEPAGSSFGVSQERINHLEERIYKACYLMDQARGNRSTPTAQSGISKEMDKTPSRDALAGIGDVIRPAIQRIYQAVLNIGGHPDIAPDVRGFDFADKASADDLELLESGAIIPVNSQRYEREIAKRAARIQLPDLNPEALAAIDDEIDSNPTPSMLEQQQKEEQAAAQTAQFRASLKAAA